MTYTIGVRLLMLSGLVVLGAQAGQPRPAFDAGRDYYKEGQFKKAAAAFQSALQTDCNDAELYYWAGMSYQRLADIATPFGGRYNSKARDFLTKAMQLAPARSDYRQALFELLLDSAASSRTALPEAARILRSMPQSDPDYCELLRRFDDERKVNSSAEARLGRLFLIAPRAAYTFAALPASALAGLRAAAALPLTAE